MNNNLIELVFILDRSGSMSNLVKDTIGGFNEILKEHKNDKENKVLLTTVLFDHEYELLHDNIDISEVKELTDNDYYVRGCTALNDAIGKTINNVGNRLNKMFEQNRPGKVPGGWF